MGKSDEQYRLLSEYIVSKVPNSHGERRMRCPFHGEDKRPSATINFDRQAWYCNKCETGGGIDALIDDLGLRNNVVSINRAKRLRIEAENVPDIPEEKVERYVNNLLHSPRDWLTNFMQKRGLTREIIEEYQIGWDPRESRYTVPVRDIDGRLVNIRKYIYWSNKLKQKWTNFTGGLIVPYPLSQLDANEILLVEGELDALTCIQHGFAAMSGTAGAKMWHPDWSRLFAGKTVFICYDNDEDGRAGAKKVAASLKKYAKVVIVPPLMPEVEASDVTDWFMKGGGTATSLRSLLEAARVAAPSEAPTTKSEAVPVAIGQAALDASLRLQPVTTKAMIVGRTNSPYTIPSSIELNCTLDAGAKCAFCNMKDWEGNHRIEIPKDDPSVISRLIDIPKDRLMDRIRPVFGIVKCDRLEGEWTGQWGVEKVQVRADLDQNDHTIYPIYSVSNSFDPNTTINITGASVEGSKDMKTEFYAWDMSPASTPIDDFKVTAEFRERMQIFRPDPRQGPLRKMREISTCHINHVTHIIGRERMHMAIDLVFHSALTFSFAGKEITRGWLELLLVGDTRTGKSETANRLVEFYRLGSVVNCESTTFAGLVGGVQKVSDEWMITWGEMVINDRRLVVLDEVSGLDRKEISQFSEVRSSGRAKMSKIQHGEAKARCRSIWISNPRSDDHHYGIDKIVDLIGNPEDIARFDFAMSVATDDVSVTQINRPRRVNTEQKYTAELCHELLLWVWSRKPEQIKWATGAEKMVFEESIQLSRTYEPSPPLVQGSNVREKIARLAVAFAARLFSTDRTGECIFVKREHVGAAVVFLDELYSYENFGYQMESERIQKRRQRAEESIEAVKKFLRTNRQLTQFLIERRGSFRSEDLEQVGAVTREEIPIHLSKLYGWGMIDKDKAQIIAEPTFRKILRELDK